MGPLLAAAAPAGPVASLNTAWFALIGLLWTGYFVLEGFDFGVGVITPLISADDTDRRLCVNAIGPTWDGNEVWLLVAGGATFAAFPVWYAVMFSAFYLPLFLVLVGLIIRGVSFEFRGKIDGDRWRRGWDLAQLVGSFLPALLWGVAFADIVRGIHLAPDGTYHGGLLGLVHPVALLGGLVSLGLFSLHGAVFLSAKTSGELADRARRLVRRLAGPVAVLMAGLTVWLALGSSSGPGSAGLPAAVPLVLGAVGVAGVASVPVWSAGRRDGWAFVASAVAIVALAAAVFTTLFPRVLVSSAAGGSLTVWSAASAHRTLVVMTVVAAVFTPFVLAYQAWSYWVFRQRLVRPPQVGAGV